MRILALALVALASGACNRGNQTTDAVRQGVIDSVSGRVNLSQMDVNVAAVNFKGGEAEATVEFRAKGGAPGSGIQMKYTLENQAGKWVVKKKTDAGGSPHGEASGGQALPPGHPPAPGESPSLPSGHPPAAGQSQSLPSGRPPGAGESSLPSGHPPAAGQSPSLPSGHPPAAGESPSLPSGHPPLGGTKKSGDAKK